MKPRSTLFLPPAPLVNCLFGGVYRDTRGVELADRDRVNHFPASPLVSVTQVLYGELRLLTTREDCAAVLSQSPLPPLFAMGPTDRPISSWAPGPVAALTVSFYHDAWLRLGGAAEYTSAPDAVVGALQHFVAEEDPDVGWAEFCTRLNPIWDERRASSWKGAHGVADWTRSVMRNAALSGSGQSLRSLERRLKRLSGQTQRTLNFYQSIDNLHMISQKNADMPLADIALEAGYSDQSHMGRAVRRATGFSPARLNHAIKTEEAFWCYRLLGERF